MSAERLKLDVDGMTCAACVASVEKIIEKSQHVKAVAVNLPLGSANIQLHQSADAGTIQEILSISKLMGFPLTYTMNQNHLENDWRNRSRMTVVRLAWR